VKHDACVIALGAVSGFGLGDEAVCPGPAGEPARSAIALDPALQAGGLARPFASRAPLALGVAPSEDRATDLLRAALAQVITTLDAHRPGWRGERLGIALGTSSGGMLSAERFFAARAGDELTPELARRATYFAPFDDALASFDLGGVAPRTQILAACAASTIALGLGLRWLARGACDLVLAGGYDGLGLFVASGFEVLRATTATRPRPFRIGRDGMSLGEGAGVVALVREGEARGAAVRAWITGFGASTDAVHITAPDRSGGGLARAGAAALADAALPGAAIDLVSAHATATPFNDAMESRALATLFASSPAPPVVHPFKAQIGHTLGAAGVLETLAAASALEAGLAPAAAGEGERDPDAPALLLDRAEPRPLRAALKLSAAFGGSNAALVLARAPSGREARPLVPVHLRAFAHVTSVDLVELAAATGVARDRLARLDTLSRLGLAAVAALAAQVTREALVGAGIVAGHGLATLDTNEGFDARRRARGATAVEPRVFPSTSPNAVAGECAIVYQLTGPSFAVSAGLDGAIEALCGAAELIAAGDARAMVVLAADDAGPAAHALLARGWAEGRALARGAVALLLSLEAEGSLREVPLDLAPDHASAPVGHLSLLRWLGERPAR
jgi:3-oxoacyl-[acyl-carrier-protein] synthase-1/3-oxoacyl-[acyl-carrier-protein] synthase II